MTPPVLIGDDVASFSVSTAERAQALAAHLRGAGGWRDVVAGLDSVAVRFDLLTETPREALERLAEAAEGAPEAMDTGQGVIEIAVRYGGKDGPDLEALAASRGMSKGEIIEAHMGALYTVEMIGFTPGFAYCSGLDPRLSSARHASPRALVPAGSVGIGGARTGIYALEGPGGWQVIGRTDAALFDAASADPFLLKPGQRVRFVLA